MKPLTKAQLYLAAPGIKVIVLTTLLVPLGVMATGTLNASSIAGYTMAGWLFGFIWLVAALFAAEFEYGTMGGLLSQPVERERIYRSKMGVVCGLGLILFGINLLLGVSGVIRSDTCFMVIAILIWGAAVTPIMALLGRTSIAAIIFTAAAGLITFQLLILTFAGRRPGALLMTVLLCSGTFLILLSSQMFQRLEMVPRDRIRWSFSRSNSCSFYKSWQHAFWRKEFMNHRFSIRAGLVFTFVTLTCSLIWLLIRDHQQKSWAGDVVATAWILQIFLMPLLVPLGAISEEKFSRTLSLDLILPVSSRKKWTIKFLLIFLVSVFFSFVVPMIVGSALSKFRFPISHDASEYAYFLTITLCVLSAGVIGACITPNSTSAFFLGLVVTITIFFLLTSGALGELLTSQDVVKLSLISVLLVGCLYEIGFRLYRQQDGTERTIGLAMFPWDAIKRLANFAFFFEPRALRPGRTTSDPAGK